MRYASLASCDVFPETLAAERDALDALHVISAQSPEILAENTSYSTGGSRLGPGSAAGSAAGAPAGDGESIASGASLAAASLPPAQRPKSAPPRTKTLLTVPPVLLTDATAPQVPAAPPLVMFAYRRAYRRTAPPPVGLMSLSARPAGEESRRLRARAEERDGSMVERFLKR